MNPGKMKLYYEWYILLQRIRKRIKIKFLRIYLNKPSKKADIKKPK